MNNKRIVFLGTPHIASYILEEVIKAGYNVVGVVSQPDKEVGRKKILTPTLTKEVANKYNIPCFQPLKLRNDYQFMIDLKPDLLISVAYGQILPQGVLDIATINNINVHGSLLPAYRGGAPIQRSIINGDKITGICIMKMVDKMDAGCVYDETKIEITDDMNSDDLFTKMEQEGAKLLLKVLPDILENKIEGKEQDESKVTLALTLKKEEEHIDFNNNARDVFNKIRGFATNPGAFALYNDKVLKIYKSIETKDCDNSTPGTLKIENKNHLYVKCKDYYLELLEVKPEGKNIMNVKDYCNGLNKSNLGELK